MTWSIHIVLWGWCLLSQTAPHPLLANEPAFRHTLVQLETAVRNRDSAAIRGLLHFPLLTAPQWTNEDLKTQKIDPKEGWIDAAEFPRYYPDIFHADVNRLLPGTKEANLSVIARDTREDYYRRLMKLSDPGAPLYEVYFQYPEGRSGGDSYFGFVFGRVSGQYKVISYYGKWPVKT